MIKLNRVELNINYDCNLRCKNCNRLCHLLRLDEPMTVDQIRLFIRKLEEENKHIVRVKVVGGEPTIHPDFLQICKLLSDAFLDGFIGKIAVNTNGINPKYRLDAPLYPGIHWKVSPPSRKGHRPVLWSPKDLGLDTFGPCAMPKRCGFSLDSKGWLPCSAAPAIVRVFNLEYLYRPLDGPLPPEIWGLEELCGHCIFSVNDEAMRGKKFKDTPANWLEATPSWKERLEKYMKDNPDKVLK